MSTAVNNDNKCFEDNVTISVGVVVTVLGITFLLMMFFVDPYKTSDTNNSPELEKSQIVEKAKITIAPFSLCLFTAIMLLNPFGLAGYGSVF